ncbi:hypothetical protein [Bacteriovorax sp. Seq25_V]|uniref:hypothetical protein n=1 Tax=Bacteriovorax sp. Seq25_V TaxID=1201288 RepID=UPI0003F97434|nr:hypothetical protein [Bacteriovorax sp. Seq25_V]
MNLKWLGKQYFQFSNFICEDDLLASEIVVNAANNLLLENAEVLRRPEVRDHQIIIFKLLLTMAKRKLASYSRHTQDLSKRAVFFLGSFLDFDEAECAYISDIPETQVLKIVESFRYKVLEGNKVKNEYRA